MREDSMADDAQRELQQRSLRNVRALLDKLENDAAAERRTRRWIAWGLFVGLAALFAGVILWGKTNSGESRTVVVPQVGRSIAAPETVPASK
jgi:hypothetical protein